ncbi:PulJ/GspJ family protein [Virgibacillus ndiopensis]|uniref:PulJ/GspJ family protein n=1 Tax=Virgibacillus ndiopensis TaxID=2004408 RepID=UPI000C0836BB|nr:type II secretion system protein [Virgibacillus ndiopensis]
MKIQVLQSQKGITLVELLAAITLFAIVIVFSSTLIVHFSANNQKTSDSIEMSQDVNVIISQLRNQYYNENTELCIHNEDISISNYTIVNGGDPEGNNHLKITNGCIQNVDNSKPIKINIQFKNKTGNQFALNTAFSTSKPHVLTVSTNNDDTELPDDNDYQDFPCKTNGSITISEDVKLRKGVCPNDTFIVTGALTTLGKISLQHDGVTLKVGGSAHFIKKVWMAQTAKIDISGAVAFNQIVLMNKDSLMRVGGAANFTEDLQMKKNSSINIGGSTIFYKNITMKKGAEITTSSAIIFGNATCNNEEISFTNKKLTCKK